MHRLGLKVSSADVGYVEPARQLYQRGVFHNLELYVLPGTFVDGGGVWKSLEAPIVIHAPHFFNGLNLADPQRQEANAVLMAEARRFADTLQARSIIVHPGVDGQIAETIRQLKALAEPRLLVENKPAISIDRLHSCVGSTPAEIAQAMAELGAGFCLDIGHAYCAANHRKIDRDQYLRQFMALRPTMFHLSDGDRDGAIDKHYHLGAGSYDLRSLAQTLPGDAIITFETVKDSATDLGDYVRDVGYWMALNVVIETADEHDVIDIFGLANDPEVRRNSFSSEPISLDQHRAWFSEKLGSSETAIYVARGHDGRFIGYVRFELVAGEKTLVISIALGRDYRGRGLARELIVRTSALQSALHPGVPIVAYIKDENLSSLKSFSNARYQMMGSATVNGQRCQWLKYIPG